MKLEEIKKTMDYSTDLMLMEFKHKGITEKVSNMVGVLVLDRFKEDVLKYIYCILIDNVDITRDDDMLNGIYKYSIEYQIVFYDDDIYTHKFQVLSFK